MRKGFDSYVLLHNVLLSSFYLFSIIAPFCLKGKYF